MMVDVPKAMRFRSLQPLPFKPGRYRAFVKVKGVNMSAEAQAARVKAGSDAELRLAVGYAIREEFAKSGNLDQAIAKTRDLIRDASMSAARDRSNR